MSKKNRRKTPKTAAGNNTDNTGYDTSNTNPAEKNSNMAFSFGDPETILKGQLNDYVGTQLIDNGEYYQPPVSNTGIARLLRANAFHGPILEFKTNMVMRGFQPSEILPRRVMHSATTDYNVFSNCYFQRIRNYAGETTGFVICLLLICVG